MVPELRKHTQIPVTQAQQGVLGTDSLWVLSLSLSRTLYRYSMCTTGSTCTLTGSPYDLRPKVARSKVAHDLRLKVAIKGRARSAMMAYLGDTTTAHNVAPPPRSTTTTPARVTYPCSHRQCQLGVQGEPPSAIDPNIRSALGRAICDRSKIHILFVRAYA